MKKEKKVLMVLGVILIIALAVTQIVYALSWKFNVTADKTSVKAGDEIAVLMQISEINMGELGINAIEAVLDYDESVFETVDRSDFKMQNNWTMTYNQEAGPKNGNFLISNLISGIKDGQTVGKIIFKIREDAKPGTTKIKFKNIKSNDGKNLVNESDKVITITIYEDGKIEPTENTNNSSNKGSIIVSGNTQKENLSPSDLPQTGDNKVVFVIAMLGIVVATVLVIRYKNIHID